MLKTAGDTRDPFLVAQIETAKQERNKAKQERDKYWGQLNQVAQALDCYAHGPTMVKIVKKYKRSYHALENMERKNKLRFLITRFYNYLIRCTAF